jgi:hypothetical protein
MDVDVGENKRYENLEDAAKGIVEFIDSIDIKPTVITYSGGGFHVYWRLDRDMMPEEWHPLAQKFKQAMAGVGMKADPSRTSDVTSLLRPANTTNRKSCYGPDGKLVHAHRGMRFPPASVEEVEQACFFLIFKSNDEVAGATTTAESVPVWYAVLSAPSKEAVLRSMLWAIPKSSISDHSEWVSVAASLSCEGTLSRDVLFHLWKNWSLSTTEGAISWKIKGEEVQRKRFESFDKSGIGVLFKKALKEGWNADLIQDEAVRNQVLSAMESHSERMTVDQAKDFLKENVVYVRGEDRYLYRGILLTKNALDQTLARHMPLGKNKEPIRASRLATNSEVVPIVQYLGYMPGALPIYTDKVGLILANTYKPPRLTTKTPKEPLIYS